jgi:hypothetical protein
MAVEELPHYPQWRAALENLLSAKKAFKDGTASQSDVEIAQQAYLSECDMIAED